MVLSAGAGMIAVQPAGQVLEAPARRLHVSTGIGTGADRSDPRPLHLGEMLEAAQAYLDPGRPAGPIRASTARPSARSRRCLLRNDPRSGRCPSLRRLPMILCLQRRTQNPVTLTGRVGSTPTSGTIFLALLKFVWVTLARFTSAMTDQAVSGSTTGRRVRCESGPGFWAASMCLEPALWKLTVPWTRRPRPPRLGKRRTFSTSFHRA